MITLFHCITFLHVGKQNLWKELSQRKKRAIEPANLMQKSHVFSFISRLAAANRAGAYLFIGSFIPSSSNFLRAFV